MTLIRLLLMLAFVALLTACSENQKSAENKQAVIEKALTPAEKFAKALKEVETGNTKAQFNLASMYAEGEGVPKNVAKAVG